MSKYDTVVIGAGLAGLTTACYLAQAKQKVLVLTHGIGALLLASGCVDVLGFQPTDSREPVNNPLDKLEAFIAAHPEHPYHLLGKETVKAGLEAFLKLVNNGMLDYEGQPHQNWLLPSTIGAVHPTCLAPTSLTKGELSSGKSMLIVGFRELGDFYPTLIAQNLNEQSWEITAESLILEGIPIPVAAQMNATPLELAHTFEKADFRQKVVKAVQSKSKGYDRVGFPAVLGVEKHAEVMADLEKQLGKPVFEISALPPSVPGRRLYEALRHTLLQAGGKIIVGAPVADGTIENGRVTQIRVQTVNRLKPVRADNYVLATGGIFGGGLETNEKGEVWEPIFGLPVSADSNRHKWFTKNFLAPEGQPVAYFGIKVNEQLNPINGSTDPIAENLFVAGRSLGGYQWTSGRTGDGVVLATAYEIANQIKEFVRQRRSQTRVWEREHE
jgi:glycerol-3-phosphate dehydrogenase subunit B